MTIAIGRPFALGRQPWKTLDPFLFCVYHEDRFPKGLPSTLGPEPALLRGREIGSDFSYKEGWSMYHGSTVPGFPSHPHFGFETVTCAMKGLVDHFDSLGATGRYGHGDVQWMTAGNGVQHSEMFPLVNDKEDGNPMELFQLWLNLPANKKTANPFFEMFWAPEVPRIQSGDADITVMAGPLAGASPKRPPPDSWAAVPDNEVAIWVLKIKKGGSVVLPATRYGADINRTVYFFKGAAKTLTLRSKSSDAAAGGASLPVSTGQQVDASAEIVLSASAEGDAEVLVLQGRPIKETVVQRGPFVTSSNEQLRDVFSRFHQTEFGGWPWPSTDHHHPREQTRFAKRPGAKENEYPPQQKE